MDNTLFPTTLESIALLTWTRNEAGALVAAFPNGAGFWKIEGDTLLSFEFSGDGPVLSSVETLCGDDTFLRPARS
jgi:hypothetical protein